LTNQYGIVVLAERFNTACLVYTVRTNRTLLWKSWISISKNIFMLQWSVMMKTSR